MSPDSLYAPTPNSVLSNFVVAMGNASKNYHNLRQGCPTRFNCGPHWLPQYFGGPHGPIYKSQIYSTPSMNAIEMWLRNCS